MPCELPRVQKFSFSFFVSFCLFVVVFFFAFNSFRREGKFFSQICSKNGRQRLPKLRIYLNNYSTRACWIWGSMANTRKSVSSGYPNNEKWVEKAICSRVFDMVSQTIRNSWINSSKSSQNFMLIKIRYPNHRNGSDFLCFLFMNY